MEEHASIEKLADYLELDLPGDEIESLAAHIAGCPVCSGELERLRTVVATLREMPRETISAEAESRLMSRLGLERDDNEPAAQSWWSRLSPAMLLPAAAVAVFVLATVLVSNPLPEMKGAPAKTADIIAEFSKAEARDGAPSGDSLAAPETAQGTSAEKAQAPSSASDTLSKNGGLKLLTNSGPLSPIVIGDETYTKDEVIGLLGKSFQRPSDNTATDRSLVSAAGAEGGSLAKAVSAVRTLHPQAVIVYAELAFYKGKRVWIIVTEEDDQRRALAVKAKTRKS